MLKLIANATLQNHNGQKGKLDDKKLRGINGIIYAYTQFSLSPKLSRNFYHLTTFSPSIDQIHKNS